MDQKTLLLRVNAATEKLESDGDLRSYAAKAALDMLAENWRAAVCDGTKPAELLHDLDMVIDALKQAKAGLHEPLRPYSDDMSPS